MFVFSTHYINFINKVIYSHFNHVYLNDLSTKWVKHQTEHDLSVQV